METLLGISLKTIFRLLKINIEKFTDRPSFTKSEEPYQFFATSNKVSSGGSRLYGVKGRLFGILNFKNFVRVKKRLQMQKCPSSKRQHQKTSKIILDFPFKNITSKNQNSERRTGPFVSPTIRKSTTFKFSLIL